MKKILAVLAGLVVACSMACAGDIGQIYFATNNLSIGTYTQAVHSLMSAQAWQGDVEGIRVQLSNVTAPTVTVSVVEEADYLDGEHTLFTKTSLAGTNQLYLIRHSVVNESASAISNEGTRDFLTGGKVRLKLYSANKTNINVKAWLYVRDQR